jgi:hypothetical protein
MFEDPSRPPNTARYIFLDPRARDFYQDWELAADNVVAVLRAASGKRPDDQRLIDLIAELSVQSDDFRGRWVAHNVRHHYSGRMHYRHPVIGEIELLFEAMPVGQMPGLTLAVYPAQPGSAAAESLEALAEWATSGLHS